MVNIIHIRIHWNPCNHCREIFCCFNVCISNWKYCSLIFKGSKRLDPGGPIIYEDNKGKAVVSGILINVVKDCLNPPSDIITTNVYHFLGTVVPCSCATPFYAIFAAMSFFTFFLGKVCTANNFLCVFPFKFRGYEFFKCTNAWIQGMCEPSW